MLGATCEARVGSAGRTVVVCRMRVAALSWGLALVARRLVCCVSEIVVGGSRGSECALGMVGGGMLAPCLLGGQGFAGEGAMHPIGVRHLCSGVRVELGSLWTAVLRLTPMCNARLQAHIPATSSHTRHRCVPPEAQSTRATVPRTTTLRPQDRDHRRRAEGLTSLGNTSLCLESLRSMFRCAARSTGAQASFYHGRCVF